MRIITQRWLLGPIALLSLLLFLTVAQAHSGNDAQIINTLKSVDSAPNAILHDGGAQFSNGEEHLEDELPLEGTSHSSVGTLPGDSFPVATSPSSSQSTSPSSESAAIPADVNREFVSEVAVELDADTHRHHYSVSSIKSWKNITHAADCAHPIYCQGELLAEVQKSKIFNDSKTFVDMPLRYSVETVLANYKNKTSLESFLVENFYAAGSDVIPHTPSDFKDYPAFLHEIKDENLKRFAHSIHRVWKDLVRKYRPIGKDSTLLPLPHPFVIPGGRFREFFYWDTYWIVQGLLVSGMLETARDVLNNLFYLVNTIGFVPNGSRLYFVNRSQPPFLTQMVLKYFDHTNDLEFLKEALPVLDKEYDFWLTGRTVQVKHPVSKEIHNLSIYNVDSSIPRPESWLEDVELAHEAPEGDKKRLYSEIASACESGWDFSSRWFKDKTKLSTVSTSTIVPVDLNVFLYKNEVDLAQLNRLVGNDKAARFYERQKLLRKAAIDAFLYNESDGVWYDWDLDQHKQRTDFTISALIPTWANLHEGKDISKIFRYIQHYKLFDFVAGVPTTLNPIPQQWDYLNAWPPLQYLVIKGLQQLKAHKEAYDLSKKWVSSNYCGWVLKDAMFEKYNASKMGVPGGGGEYIVQEGFGWTNGIALLLLAEFGSTFELDSSVCYANARTSYRLSVVLILLLFSVVAIAFTFASDRLASKRAKEGALDYRMNNVEIEMYGVRKIPVNKRE